MRKPSAKTKRESAINTAESELFDLLIIGGGVHGAALFCHAARAGYRVLLLEAADFAAATSSRSSKMLHGGVRYLEQGDIGLVREALLERAVLAELAPHLTRPQHFLFPAIRGRTRPAWQIGIGLSLYDMLAKFFSKAETSSFSAHTRLAPGDSCVEELRRLGLDFNALFRYADGQMDDARIVIEYILAGAERAGTALNYARVESLKHLNHDGEWRVRWRSQFPDGERETRAKYIVNATGPWVEALDKMACKGIDKPREITFPSVVLSRGIHLLFSRSWDMDGLILPTPTKGRYYFVWPFFSPLMQTTLVGTTDRATDEAQVDPRATEEEIDDLLVLLTKDLPSAGLDRSSLYQSFCGIRTLVGAGNNVSGISRKHRLIEREGYLALVGGKFTNSRRTAEGILSRVQRHISCETGSDLYAPLPGGQNWSEQAAAQLVENLSKGIRQGEPNVQRTKHIEAAVCRFGRRAERLIELSNDDERTPFLTSDPSALRCEIQLAIEEESAMTLEDLLRRRLGLSLTPGAGEMLLKVVAEELVARAGRHPDELKNEISDYRERWLRYGNN